MKNISLSILIIYWSEPILKFWETPHSSNETKNEDFFIPEEEVTPKKRVGEKVDPFKEADLLNGNLNDYNNSEDNPENTNNSLISRLSTVKNKAIDVGTKAFSMVSEVAHKSFDNKSEEILGSNTKEDLNDRASERIEPSFLDSGEEKMIQSSSYEDNYDREISTDNDNMNIPSFLRRNRD